MFHREKTNSFPGINERQVQKCTEFIYLFPIKDIYSIYGLYKTTTSFFFFFIQMPVFVIFGYTKICKILMYIKALKKKPIL